MKKKPLQTSAPFQAPPEFAQCLTANRKNGGLAGLRAMRSAEAEFNREFSKNCCRVRLHGKFVSALAWKQERALDIFIMKSSDPKEARSALKEYRCAGQKLVVVRKRRTRKVIEKLAA